MFYNKQVKLYQLQSKDNEWGVKEEDKYKYVKTILVDIQPYSQEKLKEEYGYDLKTTKRMFCDMDIDLTESTIIIYKDKPYKIVKIIGWDDEDDSLWDEYLDIPLDDAIGVDLIG